MSGDYGLFVDAAYGLSAVVLMATAAVSWLKYCRARRKG